MPLYRSHVFMTGKVQGVGFRFSTQDVAQVFGLAGWVRNLPDGRVEAVFEGDRKAVEAMVAWCRKGPPNAVVEKVMVTEEEPEGLSGFEIRRSK
jgi:acylphosphatase